MQALLVATLQVLPVPGNFLLSCRIAAPHGQHDTNGNEQKTGPKINSNGLTEQQPAQERTDNRLEKHE